MAKRKNLKGIPHNFTKSFFGTERYWDKGYMGDWLVNAAIKLNLSEASLNVLTARFTPAELNIPTLTINAKDLKPIIEKELSANGFDNDFITDAKMDFIFSKVTQVKYKITCSSSMLDKDGKSYKQNVIEDVFLVHFDPFAG